MLQKIRLQNTLIASALMVTASLAQAAVLPQTPQPFKYGTGVIDQQTIYIGLGSAGKAWYKLDTENAKPQWQEIAPFPGAEREQATAVLLNGEIYVFGGVGKNAQGQTQMLDDIYQYSPQTNSWKKLRSHSPLGLVGHVSFSHAGKAIIMGGVNQNIFNGYFADMAAAANDKAQQDKIVSDYFNKPIDDYFYNRDILSFDPQTAQWSYLGTFPHSGTAGSAIISDGDHVTLINGELKPGLRTDKVWSGHFTQGKLVWQQKTTVAAPDGVAGAFGGISHGQLLFAGGAGFPGSMANYQHGKYYAHQGISKHYSDVVYHFNGTQWQVAGKLPYGVAYGVALPWHDGMLIIGGETDGGKALAGSLFVTMQGDKLKVEN